MRYRAVYESMSPGGFIEWTSDNDETAVADALVWQAHYGRLVALAAVEHPGTIAQPGTHRRVDF
jgi:hypothetical protein